MKTKETFLQYFCTLTSKINKHHGVNSVRSNLLVSSAVNSCAYQRTSHEPVLAKQAFEIPMAQIVPAKGYCRSIWIASGRDHNRRARKPLGCSPRICLCHALDDHKRIGVFVSGGGSNFKAIHESCISGSIKGSIMVRVEAVFA